jgi:hypothetical protein
MRRSGFVLLGAALALSAVARAQDDEALPDLEFLEYLGSWEESDEDWVVVAEQFMGQPLPDGDEPAFTGDEESDDADDDENDVEDDDEARDDETGDDETGDGDAD